jgi:hypothetical protein
VTGEKKYTERDAAALLRTAFVQGVDAAGMLYEPSPEHWQARARGLFPLPQVTRPRVALDRSGRAWKVEDGTLRMRVSSGTGGAGTWLRWDAFKAYSDAAPLPARVALWAELFANPTEEVDA